MTPHRRSLSKSLDSLYHLLLYDMIFFTSNQNYKIPCLSDDDKSTIFFRSEFIAECMLYFQLDKKRILFIVETFLKNNLLSLRPQKLQNNPDKIKEFSIHKRHSSIPPNQTKSCMNKLRTLDLLYCISRL